MNMIAMLLFGFAILTQFLATCVLVWLFLEVVIEPIVRAAFVTYVERKKDSTLSYEKLAKIFVNAWWNALGQEYVPPSFNYRKYRRAFYDRFFRSFREKS